MSESLGRSDWSGCLGEHLHALYAASSLLRENGQDLPGGRDWTIWAKGFIKNCNRSPSEACPIQVGLGGLFRYVDENYEALLRGAAEFGRRMRRIPVGEAHEPFAAEIDMAAAEVTYRMVKLLGYPAPSLRQRQDAQGNFSLALRSALYMKGIDTVVMEYAQVRPTHYYLRGEDGGQRLYIDPNWQRFLPYTHEADFSMTMPRTLIVPVEHSQDVLAAYGTVIDAWSDGRCQSSPYLQLFTQPVGDLSGKSY